MRLKNIHKICKFCDTLRFRQGWKVKIFENLTQIIANRLTSIVKVRKFKNISARKLKKFKNSQLEIKFTGSYKKERTA